MCVTHLMDICTHDFFNGKIEGRGIFDRIRNGPGQSLTSITGHILSIVERTEVCRSLLKIAVRLGVVWYFTIVQVQHSIWGT